MIRFYFHPTPNPAKIALFLEEAGLDYETIAVDTSKGEQHQPECCSFSSRRFPAPPSDYPHANLIKAPLE
jgi:glutathione S-transferase